jgi:large subunit ribosomal protein L19e
MTDLTMQRRLAASILGVGKSRIHIAPDHIDDASQAITRDDVRTLVNMGIIDIRPPSTPSRGRKRVMRLKKSRGKRKGQGSRKGGRQVRRQEKDAWVRRVRKQRGFLAEQRASGKLDGEQYREIYLKSKGGVFPTLSALKNYIEKQVK